MSRAPTHRELEVLRYLAVGMQLEFTLRPQHSIPLVCKGVAVIRVLPRTLSAMQAAGWIDERHLLTAAGRRVVECKTFVRAFAEAPQ